MSDAISVQNLSKVYREPSLRFWRRPRLTEALRDVSFACPEHRVTCLLGPNGAGKTTLIKILAGLVLPDTGSAVTLGLSLATAPLSFRARIGLATPNERSFYWRLTGRQNLDFYAALYGLSRADRRRRTSEILAEVDLEEDADKPLRFYSAGMRQKLLLARALLGRPDVLLLDEPTSHLDPLARSGVHALIRERFVEARKATVLLCTHDLAEAEELADHLVFLHQGRVLAEGSLEAVRSRLGRRRRLRLEFQTLPRDGWDAGLPIVVAARTGTSLEIDVEDADAIPRIVEAAVRGEGRLLSCERQEPTLVDVFTRLTREEAP